MKHLHVLLADKKLLAYGQLESPAAEVVSGLPGQDSFSKKNNPSFGLHKMNKMPTFAS